MRRPLWIGTEMLGIGLIAYALAVLGEAHLAVLIFVGWLVGTLSGSLINNSLDRLK